MVARIIGAILCILLVGIPGAAKAEWHEASSDHFLVIADQSEKDVREFTERLERFHSAVLMFSGGKMCRPARLTA